MQGIQRFRNSVLNPRSHEVWRKRSSETRIAVFRSTSPQELSVERAANSGLL
jgi:hypothetical protein